jgi:hypothetical protein
MVVEEWEEGGEEGIGFRAGCLGEGSYSCWSL